MSTTEPGYGAVSQAIPVQPTAVPSLSKALAVPVPAQETQPSHPLADSYPAASIGDAGTRGISGVIQEEYLPELQGVQGVRVYDKMRKNDGTVRAAILACTLPILRANWFVKAASDEAEDTEAQQFVTKGLFNWLDINWDDFLRQALLMTVFGAMPFEKVYGIKEDNGKQWVTLTKLAPRMPRSIVKWELDDGTFGIVQARQDGVQAQIPGSKLLLFINEREGDNWWGTSMLRGAYKHWYYKDGFYHIDAVAGERQGLGVPKIILPAGADAEDKLKAEIAAKSLHANPQAYLVLPAGYDAEFMNMGGSTIRDLLPSINHHNKEILQSVLAQFLELGTVSAASGSRAVSTDHSDLFLKAMEAIASNFQAVVNKDCIPEMCDMNFNGLKKYPTLQFSGISKEDVAGLASAYSTLKNAGAITPTDADQQYLRTVLGLPERTPEEIKEDGGNGETPTNEGGNDDVDEAVTDADNTAGNKPDKKEAEKPTPTKPTPKPSKKSNAAEKPAQRKSFAESDFKPWRKLTMTEEKVAWENIQDKMDELEKDFTKAALALLTDAKDTYVKKLLKALKDDDTKAVSALELAFVAKYTKLLYDTMKQAYIYGKNNAAKEMGVDAPANTADTLANLNLMANTIATKTASDLEAASKLALGNSMIADTPDIQAVGSIDAELEGAISKSIDNASAVIIPQAVNHGRNDVFERNADDIYALQRSELLDQKTCNFCLSMDGLVIEVNDSWGKTGIYHSNCRGIWVEIMKDEVDPPAITGVPDEVGDYFGGQPNSLLQPKNPIVQEGSPAAKEVERRAKDKKK